MIVQATVKTELIAVVGTGSTVHWATRNRVGRLWSLCANNADLSIAISPDVTCANCVKISSNHAVLAQRAEERTQRRF